ncbi:Fic family protein [Hominifimenecus sp. rT4P-3]|uniref:Fic family protein n=1 Tax=Hominifimenecus sp. rT4P-3 TaxID=3242979 RepID=UPI003DA358CF
MTKYVVEESGDFRLGEEGVFNGEPCIFMAPPARDSVHPLILSSVFHYEFVFIHPFSDGNVTQRHLQKAA